MDQLYFILTNYFLLASRAEYSAEAILPPNYYLPSLQFDLSKHIDFAR